MKPLRLLAALFVIALLGAAAWRLRAIEDPNAPTRAWGNVETRQVSLAFETSGRIARLMKEEGEIALAGEVLGELDVEALQIERRSLLAALRQAEAQASLAHEGTRSEEIDAARADEAAAAAQLRYAEATVRRQRGLAPAGASSRQALDEAQYALAAARETLAAARARRTAAEAGLRPQEIEAADAALESAKAALAAIDYRIERASVLRAPSSGIVRARLAEPGDMAAPARTVFQISTVDPKWVRAYVTEAQLGEVREGVRARVFTDTTPTLEGVVSFISNTAEFTPKTVQTEELRSSLVYEVRITLPDPKNALRLGQPVTVEFVR